MPIFIPAYVLSGLAFARHAWLIANIENGEKLEKKYMVFFFIFTWPILSTLNWLSHHFLM